MKSYRNTRPGFLVIPDAGLSLPPGQVISPEKLSFQMEQALARGYLVEVADAPVEVAPVPETQASAVQPVEDAPAGRRGGRNRDKGLTPAVVVEPASSNTPEDLKKQLEEMSSATG